MKSAHRSIVAALVAFVLALGLPAVGHAEVGSTPAAGYPGFNGTVRAVVARGNIVYVGGDFTRATDSSGLHERQHLAAFNVTTGQLLPWAPKVTGITVNALLAGKTAIYVGGQFSAVNGLTRRNLARVGRAGTGAVTTKFRHRTDKPVRALAFTKTSLLIGGDFMKFDGRRRWRTAAVGLKAPYRLTKWAPKPQLGGVRDILVAREGVFLAGDFRQFDGRSRYQRLALVVPKTGALLRSFNPATTAIVFGIARQGDTIVAAIGGSDGGRVLAVQSSTGHTMWTRGTDGDVQTVGTLDGAFYVGGHFNRICAAGTSGLSGCEQAPAVRRRLAAFDAAGDLLAWDPEGNSASGVWGITGVPATHQLVTAGAFTTMAQGTISARRLAVFDSLT